MSDEDLPTLNLGYSMLDWSKLIHSSDEIMTDHDGHHRRLRARPAA